jgi:4-amino-4-deoxy-L-arabinose transferase-like glycosyltransferase
MLFASSPDMMRIHALALSEPLFIALGFASVLLLAAQLARPRRAALLGAAVLAGLAFLTRYLGGALVLAGIVVLLLPADRSWRRRGADGAVFGAVATLPMAIWLLRNSAVSGSAAGRSLAFHPVEADHVTLALQTMAGWVPIQGGWNSLPWLAALGLLVVLALRTPREAQAHRWRSDSLSPLPRVLLVFLLVYLASLLVSISFFDAGTQPAWRILAPVFVAGLVVTLCGALRLLRTRPSAALAILLGVLTLAVAGSYTRTTAAWVGVRSREGGEGYGLRRWQESELMARVKALPEDVEIYTNAADAVYILAGRFPAKVPARTIADTRRPNPNYRERLEAMGIAMRERHALVVWFDWISWRWYLPSMTQLARQLPIRRIAKLAEGEIWEYDPARDRSHER